MSFQESLTQSNKTALIIPDNGPKITYSQLNRITVHLQKIFLHDLSSKLNGPPETLLEEQGKLDKGPQLSIAIALPNSLEFVSIYLAVTTYGNIAAPLNPNYKAKEFDFYLDDLKAAAIVVPRHEHLKVGESEVIQSAIDNDCTLIETWYDSARKVVQFEIFKFNNDSKNYKSVYDSMYTLITPLEQQQNSPGLLEYFFKKASKFSGNASPDDIAMILHTSGTTGRPKAVPLTHRNITSSMSNITKTYSLNSKDCTYLVMPLFHVHGLIGALLSTLYSQGTCVIPPKFSASQFWKHFINHSCNWYTAVPTIHLIMLNVKPPIEYNIIGRIRFIRSCSAALAPDTFNKLEAKFGCPVVEAYAMTEAAHQMTSNNLPTLLGNKVVRKPGTVGVSQGGVKMTILNADGIELPPGVRGEIAVCGSNVTPGYLNNDKANSESFVEIVRTSNALFKSTELYFRTGDQGYIDSEGRIVISGRLKELINRGGEKIAPNEIDGAMLENQKVAEAVCFGVEDAKYGQVVHAAVVLKPDQSLTVEELTEFIKSRLSSFKVPSKIYFVKELPKTATGKVQRRLCAEVFGGKSKI